MYATMLGAEVLNSFDLDTKKLHDTGGGGGVMKVQENEAGTSGRRAATPFTISVNMTWGD